MTSVFELAGFAIQIYSYLVVAVVLLSWVDADPYNPVVRFLHRATDPVLRPFRKILMPLTMQTRVDFSPILVFVLLGLAQTVLARMARGGLSLEGLGLSLVDGVAIFLSAVVFIIALLLGLRILVDVTGSNRMNPIVQAVRAATDPIAWRFRSFRGRNRRFDAAPAAALAAFLALYALIQFLRIRFL